jgi:hypothetical protein
VTILVAAYFGGRASTVQRISELEGLSTLQRSEINGLAAENKRLTSILNDMMKSVGSKPLPKAKRTPAPGMPGLPEAEPGVYFLAPINR